MAKSTGIKVPGVTEPAQQEQVSYGTNARAAQSGSSDAAPGRAPRSSQGTAFAASRGTPAPAQTFGGDLAIPTAGPAAGVGVGLNIV